MARTSSSLLAVACLSLAAPLAEAQISTSVWYNVVNKGNGKCVDARSAATANGTAVQQYACNATNAQQWQFQATSSGYYRVGNRSAANQVWDVSGVSAADGGKIHLWAYGGGNNQQWLPQVESGGTYRFVSRHSGKCLDVPGASASDGVQLQQWACNGSAAQSFRLQQAGTAPQPTATPTTGPRARATPTSSGTWRRANLTNFTSYPDPNSDECVNYNGCLWAGYFAFVNGKQTEQWVRDHNIAAVHERDAQTYRLKNLRLRQGTRQIDVTVYDMCADSDCSGCCTRNANANGIGFLIDIEKYTMQRFGSGSGIVDWQCLNCP
jgi:hypothetical protein